MNNRQTLDRLQMLAGIEQMIVGICRSSDDAEEDHYMLMSLWLIFDDLLIDHDVPRALAHLDCLKELTDPAEFPRDQRYDFTYKPEGIKL